MYNDGLFEDLEMAYTPSQMFYHTLLFQIIKMLFFLLSGVHKWSHDEKIKNLSTTYSLISNENSKEVFGFSP